MVGTEREFRSMGHSGRLGKWFSKREVVGFEVGILGFAVVG